MILDSRRIENKVTGGDSHFTLQCQQHCNEIVNWGKDIYATILVSDENAVL